MEELGTILFLGMPLIIQAMRHLGKHRPASRFLLLMALSFAATAIVDTVPESIRLGIKPLSYFIIPFGISLAWAAIAESNLRRIMYFVFGAWSCFFAAGALCGLGDIQGLFPVSYVSMAILTSIGVSIVDKLEGAYGIALDGERLRGVAIDFPSESGLVLTILVLLGCAPGSLLFIVEDFAVGQIVHESITLAIGALLLAVLTGVSCYRGFIVIFHGSGNAGFRGERLPGPSLSFERAVLAIVIVLGLLPRLVP
jgi:uncharacterized protein (DUF697 family)/uncharacterized membrane protein